MARISGAVSVRPSDGWSIRRSTSLNLRLSVCIPVRESELLCRYRGYRLSYFLSSSCTRDPCKNYSSGKITSLCLSGAWKKLKRFKWKDKQSGNCFVSRALCLFFSRENQLNRENSRNSAGKFVWWRFFKDFVVRAKKRGLSLVQTSRVTWIRACVSTS